jgi:hypothetical protein
VKAFYSTKWQMHIPPERLDLGAPGCSDRIAGREAREEGRFEHLDELWADPTVLRRTRG